MQFLHTRFRVKDLRKSIEFYEKIGFILKSAPHESPQGNQITHLEIPKSNVTLELAFSPDNLPQIPEDLIHIAIGVEGLTKFCEQLEQKGIEIWPDNWKEEFKKGNKMAFLTDPDGYEIELLEKD